MKLIIIRGLPGSGKTTLAHQLMDSGVFEHFEADHFFVDAQGQYNFDRTKLTQAHEQCFNNTKNALEAGKRVIVSNTFTTLKEVQPYLKLANDLGISPTIVVCENKFSSVHSVPQETMDAMRKRFRYNILEN